MAKQFLSAAWRNVCMVNYEVDPVVLFKYLPSGLTLDSYRSPYDGTRKYYISLVGFEFSKLKVKGVKIPFLQSFPEVNLRFYVKGTDTDGFERKGICFIKEITPSKLINFTCNRFYNEKFETKPMLNHATKKGSAYSVYDSGEWRDLIVYKSESKPKYPDGGTLADWLINRRFGFGRDMFGRTTMYAVTKDPWSYVEGECEVRGLDKLYSSQFHPFLNAEPVSSYILGGSNVLVSERNAFY